MQSSIGARLLQIIPTMLLVSVIVFALQHLLPGDPAVMLAGDSAGDPHVVAQIRDHLLLNRPIWQQYLHWLLGALHGDLGYSWELSAPVTTLLLQKLPVTLQLSAMAFVIALAIGIPLGVTSAVKKGTPLDWLATSVGLFGLSVPSFWLGIVLILVVSVDLGWLPPSGYVPLSQDPLQSLRTTIMPAFVLGNAIAAIIMRHTKSAMLTALQQDYVRTARAKGLSESVVVWHHALRNALIPVVTTAGLQLGTLLSGAVLTEQVFDIPGIGKLVVDAVFNRDYPVIQGVVLVTGLLYVLINLATDILYAAINPRLRGG
jgi:peptide/nickel transport system permease protein